MIETPAAGAGGAVPGADGRLRCPWANTTEDYAVYHDLEWGRPVRGERALFERVTLEAFQSGLSWLTILRKRDAFREVFAGFDPAVVAGYAEADVLQHRGRPEVQVELDAPSASAR